MDRTSLMAAAIVGCIALFMTTQLHAQAHGVSANRRATATGDLGPEQLAAELGTLAAWLKQLEGKYRVEVTYQAAPEETHCQGMSRGINLCMAENDGRVPPSSVADGLATCAVAGTSAGVSCQFTAKAAQIPGFPLTALFEVDAETPGIRLMETGIGEGSIKGAGFRKGDTVTFSLSCSSTSICPRGTRIQVPPGGKSIVIQIDAPVAEVSGGRLRLKSLRAELRRIAD